MKFEDLREFLIREPDVIHDRSPDDSMFEGDEAHYRGTGLSALRCTRLALLAAGRTGVKRILDLPCGYGRVMRYLRGEFPDADIVGCDLERGGVDFCAETFGAIPAYSDVDLSKLELPGKFDLIWCGSLLTHLPAERWDDVINLFDSVLEPGGLMIFTVHGRMTETYMLGGTTFGMGDRTADMLQRFETERFAYEDYDDEAVYGISLARSDWVMKQMQLRPGLRLLSYTEAAWLRHQDVVVIHRPPVDWTDRPPAGSDF